MPRFKRTLRAADRLVVVDERARDHYAEYYPRDRIEILPYGVDLDRFKPSPLPGTPKILMVNRLIERRGVHHMVEALPSIVESVSGAELHVVGDGPQREALEARAADAGVSDHVTFHGNVDADELVRLHRSTTVFAHLSFADGWNQPALEAMASGRPVVCTDAGHNSMVVDGETGYKVPWNDADAVAERVIDLLADPDLARTMGSAGRRRAEADYDWHTIAEGYHRVFQSVST